MINNAFNGIGTRIMPGTRFTSFPALSVNGLPRFWHYPLTRGLRVSIEGLHRRLVVDSICVGS